MTEELRCYTFTHFMLSPIQQGIQSGHASMELVNRYTVTEGWVNGHAEFLREWIAAHKTIVCLNGGNSKGLHDLYGFLSTDENTFPFVKFHEDEDSMEGILTSIALILPARIFETSQLLRRLHALPVGVEYVHDKRLHEHRFSFQEDQDWRHETFTEWEFELMQRLSRCGLAR